MEVNEGPSLDGFSVPLRLHNLLLALAGRIDDTALTEARELIARAHLDEAVELTTGTLIAGRIPVRSSEQRELALVLEMSRSDATLANELIIDEAEPPLTHRFTGEGMPESGVSEALDRTLHVLPDVRSVHAVWRNTPAGSVPGALPQRVVLVEIGPEGNPPAVAFRVDTALRRAGIRAVVEVSGPGARHSEYHHAAGLAASPVWVTGTASSSSNTLPIPPTFDSFESAPAPKAVVEKPAVVKSKSESSRHGLRAASAASSSTPPTPVVPVVSRAPASEAVPETRAERTSELSSDEVKQLRRALAEDPEKGREIVAGKAGLHEVVELPALDLDDPALSERDRALLRELHAELAEREREEAAKIRATNGASRGPEQRGWADGYAGA
ncbi:MAG: hypothetical protein QOI21_6281 [Actinomycetota bacterium]|jgi:hypothetical protein|nr:hypothetical protein [Actinomycetota bacterium]